MKKTYFPTILLLLLLCILCIFEIPTMGVLSEQGTQRHEKASEGTRGSTVVFIEPENVTVPMGGTFNIAIKIDDVEDLFGFQVRMSWDPGLVKYVSHTVTVPVESYPNGVLYNPTLLVRNEVNESGIPADPESLLNVAYVCMAPAPSFNGSGTILEMSFEVIGTGECELNLTKVDLANQDAQRIQREIRSGHFKSIPSDHDLVVFLDAPKHVWPKTSLSINATVVNAGLNSETDVVLQLMINSEIVDMATTSLGVYENYVLSYQWTPVDEAFYNVTAYALPISDETNLDNNGKNIDVLVAETIKVPAHFQSIQTAINIAIPGTTVHVSSGTYHEYLVINKKLTLVGEGETTIIDGLGTAYVVEVDVGDSRIEGFTITNGTQCGIYLRRVENVDILHNHIKEIPRGYAIVLAESTHINIRSNFISDVRDGVTLDSSHDNILMWNNIMGASSNGIHLANSDHNRVFTNEVRLGGRGIFVRGGYNNTIKRNEVSECSTGVSIYHGWSNSITQNTLSKNEWGGVYLWSTSNNEIYHNNFISNTIQAETEPGDIWHNSDFEGNYWNDYSGEDLDGDGVGDTMLPHYGVDSYPLIDPWHAIVADLTVDDKVDLFDLITVASAYRIGEEDYNWLPQADLAPQWGIIDIFDIVTAAYYYGQQH